MKKVKNNDGIAGWKIDSPVERLLSKFADKSSFGKFLYVNYYRVFDRKYFNKGLTFIDKTIKTFVGEVSQKHKKLYTYDMVYSLHRFGCMFDEYFLMDFPSLNLSARDSFITDKIRWGYYSRMNLDENKELFNNKGKAYELFGKFYKRDLIELLNAEDKDKFDLFIKNHSRFIVKPIDGSGGKGIYIVDLKEHNDFDILFEEIISNGAVVVEELINQSPEMAVFNNNSVNTVRVPTLKLKDRTIVFHPFIRTGTGTAVVDNAFSGGVFAAVDAETGICISKGINEKGQTFLKHPDTNTIYPGFQIPKWEEAVKLVTELAEVVEGNHYVGWDIALTDKGWVMVEGNPRGQFVEQFATKKGIKHELENYIAQM